MIHAKVLERRIEYLNKIFENENKKEEFEVDFNLYEIDKSYQELNPETIIIEKEEYDFLRYVIENRLSREERDILKMRFGLDSKQYTYKEISKILKININLVLIFEKDAIRNLKFFLTNEDLFYKKKSSK